MISKCHLHLKFNDFSHSFVRLRSDYLRFGKVSALLNGQCFNQIHYQIAMRWHFGANESFATKKFGDESLAVERGFRTYYDNFHLKSAHDDIECDRPNTTLMYILFKRYRNLNKMFGVLDASACLCVVRVPLS